MLPSSLSLPSQSTIVLPQYQGYISVAPNGRYFQDEIAQGFVIIGHNDAITWPGLVELLESSSTAQTEAYIKDLRAHGINTSRIMLEYAQFEAGYLETAPGEFSPNVVRFWDEFIHLAERHGLYLLLTPYDTFWQVHHWANYSYQRVVEHKHDWLTSPDSIAAHKQRWEFVIKRWGGSPNILAWDLMNEIELYWGATPEEIEAYITEMATFVRQLEVKTWGRTHMLTVSSASATPSGKLGNVIYNHPELDFANTHLYVGLGIRAPIDAIEGAEEMIDGVQLSLQAIHRTRPYLDTESGPIDQWISDLTLDQKYHHHLSWAHLISGGAGSGMRWPYTQPHWLLPEFRQNLLGLARFATAVDWVNFNSRPINGLRLGKPGILKTGCTDGKTALLWLLRDTRLENPPSLSGVHVHIPYVLTDGEYQVELWETTHGILFDQLTAQVTYGKTAFALPELPSELDDIALILRQRQS